ncbi:MAG TPA: TolC family protein [Prolixibacteraceae bacterium]|nr:TolC family protein [Prolixibacteraceae bacterium]
MYRCKHLKGWIRLIITLMVAIPNSLFAQSSLELFLDSALVSNPDAAAIQSQIRSYQFANQMISAEQQAPKAYISSEVLIAPYLNNGGRFIDTEPSAQAIGYDVGITNGGLYSLLFNIEIPLLKGKQVTHLQEQNQLEVNKLKTRLSMIENELARSVGNLYFDALTQQVTMENNRSNLSLLNEEFQIIKSLTTKGLYRISDYKLLELELRSDSINLNTSVHDFELSVRQLKVACGIHNRAISRLTETTVEITKPRSTPSLFTQSFAYDSLASIAQQNVFNDRYLPLLNVYANSGLNSTSIPQLQRHVGASAGVQLTYNLFDGHQKKINQQQQLLQADAAVRQKDLKINEVVGQAEAYLQNINSTRIELSRQKQIQQQYGDLLKIYQSEVRSAQISVVDFIAFMKKYREMNLAVRLKEIMLNKLINEYNYWNH